MSDLDFNREIRDDFEIAPMVKRCWAGELKVLSEIDRICDIYGLKYFADYGTLIGAVRHRGFIPWDDDIDICMLRKDYMKFISVAQKELPESFVIHTHLLRADHREPFTVIMNRETVGTLSDDLTKEYFDCPFILGVEIYPLDYVPRDLQEREVLRALHGYVYDCGREFSRYEADGSLPERILKIQENTGVVLGNAGMPLVQEVRILADRLAMMYSAEEADELLVMYDLAIFENPVMRKKEWYADSEYLPFEDMMIAVPVGYYGILTAKYGDFMIPVKNTGSHEYPFYKAQFDGLSPEDFKALSDGGEL